MPDIQRGLRPTTYYYLRNQLFHLRSTYLHQRCQDVHVILHVQYIMLPEVDWCGRRVLD